MSQNRRVLRYSKVGGHVRVAQNGPRNTVGRVKTNSFLGVLNSLFYIVHSLFEC